MYSTTLDPRLLIVSSEFLPEPVFSQRLSALLRLTSPSTGGVSEYVTYGLEKIVRADTSAGHVKVRMITEAVLKTTLQTSEDLPPAASAVVLDELFRLSGLKLYDPVKVFPGIVKGISENLRSIADLPVYFMRFLLLVDYTRFE